MYEGGDHAATRLFLFLSLVISVRGHFDSRAGSARPPLIELSRPPTRGPFPPSPRTSGLRGLRSGCGRTPSSCSCGLQRGAQGHSSVWVVFTGKEPPLWGRLRGKGGRPAGRASSCRRRPPPPPPHFVPPLRGWEEAGGGRGQQGLRPRAFGNSALSFLQTPSSRSSLLSHSYSSVFVCAGGGFSS